MFINTVLYFINLHLQIQTALKLKLQDHDNLKIFHILQQIAYKLLSIKNRQKAIAIL